MSAPPSLPGFLGTIAPVLNHWGYLAVGGLLFLEDFGVPVPGETVLIAAAVYAGAGQLNIWLVMLIGFLAAVVGDSVGYCIGRFGGRRLVLRFGRFVLITPERLDKAERFFIRHGGKIVTVARFIEGLRQANGIIAGISGMRWTRFLAFNALGAAIWVGLWASLSDLAGNHLTAIWDAVERYQWWVIGGIIAVIALLVIRHLVRRRRRGREIPPLDGDEPATNAADNGGAPTDRPAPGLGVNPPLLEPTVRSAAELNRPT